MSNKVYGVYWGFYGGMDDTPQLESLWTTEELAKKVMLKEVKRLDLAAYHEVFRKKTPIPNLFTDGNYHISIQELSIDTPSIYGELNEEQ